MNDAMKEGEDQEQAYAVAEQRQGQRKTLGLKGPPAFPHRRR